MKLCGSILYYIRIKHKFFEIKKLNRFRDIIVFRKNNLIFNQKLYCEKSSYQALRRLIFFVFLSTFI